ncbi:acylphosphatase [Gammaproteobacteria bacterium 45_16_T64]|nr:acylphosphatase [Gammaproteobacteria bacterium 45_16_T64]
MKKRIHAIVSGRVQGVYYRASTQKQAKRLGLSGWVQNLPNGNVEFEAEGNTDIVDQLIDWAHEGPALAKVTEVIVSTQPLNGTEQEFSVRY